MNRQLFRFAIAAALFAVACHADGPQGGPPAPAAPVATVVEEGSVPAEQERYESYRGTEAFLPKATGFQWKMMLTQQMPQYEVFLVSFPSPISLKYPETNTVFAEYYRPVGKVGVPGVVVLHILGGDFEISRILARHLASRGIGAMFVYMSFYGSRRPKGVRRARLLSEDIDLTLAAIQQTLTDVRRAALWLSLRPEVDPQKIGIAGTSLGAFIGCLAAGVEPRFRRCVFVLGGGDIAKVIWEGKETAKSRKRLEDRGVTYESLADRLQDVDPLTYAGNIDRRGALMINATKDAVVPPRCTIALWEKMGRPQILWYNANHYTMIMRIFDVLVKISDHFDSSRWDVERENRDG
ncbi:MAG: alpha/beta hydrolase family protein [Planctomycetes bacterium]|nr:alpha/beta hydrolase family protein [Planctomycetota bacterium]